MAWKEFFHKTFEKEYTNGEYWGDLAPYKVTTGGVDYYGVGYIGAPAGWKFGPKIQHPQGVRTRITVRYFFWADSGATGTASIGIVFYKNDETSKDPNGNDLHGASHTLSTQLSENLAEKHELVLEYDGYNKITWYADNQKLGETTLELPLTSFKIAVATDEANGGNVGIIIYEVVAEYYDIWEDLMKQAFSLMNFMLPFMIIIMIVPVLLGAVRTKRKEKEERRIIVV